MAVYFYGCITLDGYMAAKGHGLDWLYDTGSPEETSYDEFYSHMDVTLMGRRSRRSKKQGIQPLFIPQQKIMSSPTERFPVRDLRQSMEISWSL